MLFLFIFLDIYSLAICNYKSIAEIMLFKKCQKPGVFRLFFAVCSNVFFCLFYLLFLFK